MGHAAKAILPITENGPYGQRIGISVTGSQAELITAGAYLTKQSSNSSDNSRYSIVVLNA